VEDRLRLLAHWHARRREVDVSARLGELSQALDAERAAFEAFAAEAALVAVDRSRSQVPVDEVAVARRRAVRARLAMTAAVHPSVSEVLQQIEPPPADLHVLNPPAPRHPQEEGEPADS
jgi:hypothetical protein